MSSVRISDSIETFLQWARQRFAASTCELYRHYLYRFRDNVGKENLHDLKRLDIENFSIRKHPLEIVRRWLRWCVDVAQVIDKTPAAGVDVPKSGKRSRILSRGEMVTLRRRSRRPLRALLLALQETGARPIEIRQATWGMIRCVQDREIDLHQLRQGNFFFELESYKGKTRRKNQNVKRVIPISPRLGRLIARLLRCRVASVDYIFLSPLSRPWSRNALRMQFRRLLVKTNGGTMKDKGAIVPYTYRHSLATVLANQGTNARLLADFLGHSSLELLGWYVHASTQNLCDILKPKQN